MPRQKQKKWTPVTIVMEPALREKIMREAEGLQAQGMRGSLSELGRKVFLEYFARKEQASQ